ncbi:MAG: CRISPR-associated protein Cas4 [Oscillospiraceae bacterium]|jgi:CRISPR-associated exonuclease Cas4
MSEYNQDEYLQLSGIQHFVFCRRQWALIHIEHQWSENLLTVEGELMHERAHDEGLAEKRGDLITIRGLRISSSSLGVSGKCDVVEFRSSETGITLFGRSGKWQPYPVEYKRGLPKSHDADRLQLCCQAMCLEEMLGAVIPEGSMFYGEQRRREKVGFTGDMRKQVKEILSEMHELYRRGHTPKVKTGVFCRSCSLSEICLPKLCRNVSALAYLKEKLKEETADAPHA